MVDTDTATVTAPAAITATATAVEAEMLLPQFELDRVLNQDGPVVYRRSRCLKETDKDEEATDQAGRRIVLYGSIHDRPALLTLERAPFSSAHEYLSSLPSSLASLKNLGANDIYFWYMASSGAPTSQTQQQTQQQTQTQTSTSTLEHMPTHAPSTTQTTTQLSKSHEDLKINLIYPCSEQHVKKYSRQGVRVVTETPAIYAAHIRPYMQAKRDEGRLNWVWNIIDGKSEVEDVILRTPLGENVEEGFLLAPDLNWDRKTMESLHLLAIVERRDLWSLRDLKKRHVGWLTEMRTRLIEATVETYPMLEEDQVKLYVHYQPTYYHFHIHIVHVQLEAGGTQAVGKAIGLESIIAQLEAMEGDLETGMDSVALTYTLGEASELWTEIFEPIKRRNIASPRQSRDR